MGIKINHKEKERNIKGEKFGKLEAIEFSRKQKNKTNTKIYWLFKCECGKEKEILKYNVVSGKTVSCGCLRNKKASELGKANTKDISGQVFGKLTVLKKADSENGKTRWLCKCECNKNKIVTKSNLISGTTISCGCYAKRKSKEKLESILKNSFEKYNEIGKKYNKLLAIKELEQDKNGLRMFLCLCDCGNNHIVAGVRLRNGHVKSCGCYNIESHSGKNNKRYNSELTDEERTKNRYQLYGKHLKKWSRDVFIRDGFTCKICDFYSKKLNAHHLDGWNWCKEKRYEVSNGITLCECCHVKFHKKYGYGNNTKKQFEEYSNSIKPSI